MAGKRRPVYTSARFFFVPFIGHFGSGIAAALQRWKSLAKRRAPGAPLRLDNEKQLLKHYYAGQRMESPMGGYLMLLGLRHGEDGDSIGIFECSASSLRYEMVIPKATRTERKKVKDALDDGEDPDCPRHGHGTRLVRAGRDLVCMSCGVAYAKAS